MIKTLINNIIFTISTFTQLPSFSIEFKRENTKYVYLILPFVGIIVGVITYIIIILLSNIINEIFILSILLLVANILITGGIHFDGLLDSLDAFKSYRIKEEKLRIVKDPRVGAFALIYFTVIILLFLITYFYVIKNGYFKIFLIIPVFSRTLLLFLINFNSLEKNDMLDSIWHISLKKYWWVFTLLYFNVCILFFPSIITAALFLVGLLYLIYYNKFFKKHFDNLNGDLCGYFIVTVELVMFLFMAIYIVVI